MREAGKTQNKQHIRPHEAPNRIFDQHVYYEVRYSEPITWSDGQGPAADERGGPYSLCAERVQLSAPGMTETGRPRAAQMHERATAVH